MAPWTGPVLPALPLITYPAKMGLTWSGVKQDALSGKRVRYSLFSYPTRSYDIPISGLRTAATFAEWQDLVGFINSVAGTVGLFGYTDPNDNSVTAQEFGSGDGSTKGPFQLVRTLGGFTEPVFLLNGAPEIYVNSVLKTLTTDYTLDNYGNVTFTAAPGNGLALTWTGSWYVGCRFDDDVTDFELFVSNIFAVKSLKFSSEKLP